VTALVTSKIEATGIPLSAGLNVTGAEVPSSKEFFDVSLFDTILVEAPNIFEAVDA